MKRNRLTVTLENKPIYDIVFRSSFEGLKDELALLNCTNRKVCIVTETKVASLYLDEIKDVVTGCCRELTTYVFPEGESNKNLDTVYGLYEHLIQHKFDRTDLLIALGGGVPGDLTGFAAATFLRGIDFIQVPTTLLAQVDSSIGGKTGVDFKAYKNMVGAFHMPKLVYMNLKTLETLPEREFHCGLGEIIKHGLIKDREYLRFIDENREEIKKRDQDILRELVYGSCLIKKGVVERDPKEKGERAMLNFGHTLGHSIEKEMNFSLLHGECVALGCLAALSISYKMGNISQEEHHKNRELIRWFGYPVDEFAEQIKSGRLSIEQLIETTRLDKKMDQGCVKFIILKEIGNAEIVKTVTDDLMKEALTEMIYETE